VKFNPNAPATRLWLKQKLYFATKNRPTDPDHSKKLYAVRLIK